MATNRPRSLVGRKAGVGLTAGSGGTLDVDISELPSKTTPILADSIALLNSVGDVSSKSTLAALFGVLAAKLKHVLADGTAAATAVTVSGMAVGDHLISVHAQATKAAIATCTDRTAEYAIGAGELTKAAGTNETNNQLDIWYVDLT